MSQNVDCTHANMLLYRIKPAYIDILYNPVFNSSFVPNDPRECIYIIGHIFIYNQKPLYASKNKIIYYDIYIGQILRKDRQEEPEPA